MDERTGGCSSELRVVACRRQPARGRPLAAPRALRPGRSHDGVALRAGAPLTPMCRLRGANAGVDDWGASRLITPRLFLLPVIRGPTSTCSLRVSDEHTTGDRELPRSNETGRSEPGWESLLMRPISQSFSRSCFTSSSVFSSFLIPKVLNDPTIVRAICRSMLFITTPSSVTCPRSTMMWIEGFGPRP